MKYFDSHAHTNLSYCADNSMTLELYRQMLDAPDSLVGCQGITNHGFQAYFPSDIAWSWSFLDSPHLFDQYKQRGDDLLLQFKEELEGFDKRFIFGVETELMADGRLTVSDEVKAETDLLIGSLHVFPEAYTTYAGREDFLKGFIEYTRDIARTGIHILAHPFRCLTSEIDFIPREIIVETIAIAKEHDIAIELNARGRTISRLMLVREVAEAGATLSLATDAHTIVEAGDLSPHLAWIKNAGYLPEELELLQPPAVRPQE